MNIIAIHSINMTNYITCNINFIINSVSSQTKSIDFMCINNKYKMNNNIINIKKRHNKIIIVETSICKRS